jgi:hypothetical protein
LLVVIRQVLRPFFAPYITIAMTTPSGI